MRRVFSWPAAALTLLTVLTGVVVTTHIAEAATPTRVMVYGDSLTQQSSGDRTWRCRVWRHLTGLGVPVDMVGPRRDLWNWRLDRAGSTQYSGSGCDTDHASQWGMQFRSPVYDVSDMVRDYHPDVLVGLIGLNDLLYGLLSPEQLSDRWRSEITASREIAPSTDFVLVPVPDTWYANVDDYNARLSTLAGELDSVGSRVVVSASAGLVPATDTIDSSHPSANGEERIAASVADSLAVLGLGRAWPRPLVTRAPGPEMAPVPRVVATEGRIAASWTRPDYANAERVWMRDATAGQPWVRRSDDLPGTTWWANGVGGHTYSVQLQPVKGSLASGTKSTPVSVRVPARPRAVTYLRVARLRGCRAAASWHAATYATGYAVVLRDVTARGRWRVVGRPTSRTPRFVTSRLFRRHLYVMKVRSYGPLAGAYSAPRQFWSCR